LQKEFWEAYRDKSVLVVSIDLGDGQDDVKAFQERHHLTFPVLMDPDRNSSPRFQKDFVIPYNLLVDGQMVVRYSGSSLNSLHRRVVELLSTP
jgi:peroxiredoxin